MLIVIRFYLILILLFPLQLFSFEKIIPAHSHYIGFKISDNINNLLFNLLAEPYKSMIYQDNNVNHSLIKNIMNDLEKEKTQYIEIFFHESWGALVRLEVKNKNHVVDVLMKLLEKEGFMPKIAKNTQENILIESQSPQFTGSQIFILKEKDSLIIAPKQEAINAWVNKKEYIEHFQEIETLFSQHKDSLLFSYNTKMNSNNSSSPYFSLFSHSLTNPKTIMIHTLFHTSFKEIEVPNFIKNNALLLFSGDSSHLEKFKNYTDNFPVISSFINLARQLEPITTNMNLVLQDGNLISINEGKLNDIKAYIVLKVNNRSKVINLLKRRGNIKELSSLNSFPFYEIKDKLTNKALPTYVLIKNDYVILSLNKAILKDISIITSSYSSQREISVDIASILDKFPILKSICNQASLNLDQLKTLTGNKTLCNLNYCTQEFKLTLK